MTALHSHESAPDVVVVGDLVEDIIVHPSGPIREASDTPSRVMRRRGGSAANVAVSAARNGSRVAFVGAVGDDEAGRSVVSDLRDHGVEVIDLQGSRTGTIVILVDNDGERTMLPDRGASAEYESIPAAPLAAPILHLTTYSLLAEPTRSACIEAARYVRAHGGIVSIDASSASLIEDAGVDVLLDIWRACDPQIFFANEDEAATLGLTPGTSAPVDVFIIKHGSQPTEVCWQGADGLDCLRVEVPDVEDVVDLTGAGDAFAGGFLAALDPARHCDPDHLRTCVMAGHMQAAQVIQHPGA